MQTSCQAKFCRLLLKFVHQMKALGNGQTELRGHCFGCAHIVVKIKLTAFPAAGADESLGHHLTAQLMEMPQLHMGEAAVLL